jgi:pyrimidine deaminase RibD-like protein
MEIRHRHTSNSAIKHKHLTGAVTSTWKIQVTFQNNVRLACVVVETLAICVSTNTASHTPTIE